MLHYYYVGGFPPPFGGVTIKNKNLFAALSERLPIKKIDFKKVKRGNFREVFRMVRAFMDRKAVFAIGIAGRGNRRTLCKLLYKFNRKAMERSVLFLMGGSAADDFKDKEYREHTQHFRKVYAETAGMVKKMEEYGMKNAACYPNCRFKPEKAYSPASTDGMLRCVFFSIVRPEKGVNIILEAAKLLPNVRIDFYGPVDDAYKEEYFKKIDLIPTVRYRDVFSGSPEEVYAKLNEYNVVLLPTHWKAEGVPGILVEAKIACVPAIVSDYRFNSEIVHDGVDGYVLKDYAPQTLADAITRLDEDRALLAEMSESARKDAEHYYIENLMDEITGILIETDMPGVFTMK